METQHKEQHLVGKSLTVVYTIKDPTEWRKTNPLHYAHDGLEAYCVSVGDLSAIRDTMEETLKEIADEDYRGNRSSAANNALRCLEKVEEMR